MNLLKDFDGVADWINDCDAVQDEHRDNLSKHEVLRMCEGVGKLLLRKPDEVISMETTPRKRRRRGDSKYKFLFDYMFIQGSNMYILRRS